MKRLIFVGLLIYLTAAATTVVADISKTAIRFDTVQPAGDLTRLLRSLVDDINDEFDEVKELGTGNVYYVDSAVGSSSYTGTAPEWAMATLDQAVAKCTANNGDIIYVMPGHNEALTAADGVDLDVAGITVIGLGSGSDRPRFDYDNADGEFVIGAVAVRIRNLTFLPSVTGITHAIDVENGGDWAIIESCEFLEGETAGTDEFVDCIQVGTTATNVTVRYNIYTCISGAAAPNNFVDLSAATISNPSVYGNIIKGNFAEAGIWAGAAVPTDVVVIGNYVWNATASQFCIEFQGNATGVIANNICHSATVDYEVDPGTCYYDNNSEGATMPEGTSLYDLVGTLRDAAAGTGVYPTGITDDSIIAMILSKSATAAASSYNNTTDSLEALADTLAIIQADTEAQDTEAEIGAMGSVLVDNIVAAMDVNGIMDDIKTDTDAQDSEAEWADLGSTLVDNIVAAIDANSVDTAILNDLGGISQIGDKIVADMDANSVPLAILTDLAGISQLGDKIVADMDANSVLDGASAALPAYNKGNYLTVTVAFDATTGAAHWGNAGETDEVLTVTGAVRIKLLMECTETCTGTDGGTIALWAATNEDIILAATTINTEGADNTNLDAGEIWLDTSPTEHTAVGTSGFFDFTVVGGLDVGLDCQTQDIADGTIVFHVWWTPLDATGNVVAGDGGTM